MIWVIPAIDLMGGQVVRLQGGAFEAATAYATDPVAVARHWIAQGAARLHVVDLDGARQGRPVHLSELAAIAAAARGAPGGHIPVQAGGGLRDLASIGAALEAGADSVMVGTGALEPGLVQAALAHYGPERVWAAIDVRDGQVAVRGWQATEAGVTPGELARRLYREGMRYALVTDVSRDGRQLGLRPGPGTEVAAEGLRVVLAGGVASLEDVRRAAALASRGVVGLVVGKALYEGALRLPEALAVAAAARPAGEGGATGPARPGEESTG